MNLSHGPLFGANASVAHSWSSSFSSSSSFPWESPLSHMNATPSEQAEMHSVVNAYQKTKRRRLEQQQQQQPKQFRFDVYWNIITSSDGRGYLSDEIIGEQMDKLNHAFAGLPGGELDCDGNVVYGRADANISFSLRGIARVTQDRWFRFPWKLKKEIAANLRRGDCSTLNIYTTDYDWSFSSFPVHCQVDDYDTGVFYSHFEVPGDLLVHEVGHWCGLQHVFEGGCGDGDGVDDGGRRGGDFVADTPPMLQSDFGVCRRGKDTCPGGGLDSIHNYMDYSGDCCQYEFTEGQIERMHALLEKYRLTDDEITDLNNNDNDNNLEDDFLEETPVDDEFDNVLNEYSILIAGFEDELIQHELLFTMENNLFPLPQPQQKEQQQEQQQQQNNINDNTNTNQNNPFFEFEDEINSPLRNSMNNLFLDVGEEATYLETTPREPHTDAADIVVVSTHTTNPNADANVNVNANTANNPVLDWRSQPLATMFVQFECAPNSETNTNTDTINDYEGDDYYTYQQLLQAQKPTNLVVTYFNHCNQTVAVQKKKLPMACVDPTQQPPASIRVVLIEPYRTAGFTIEAVGGGEGSFVAQTVTYTELYNKDRDTSRYINTSTNANTNTNPNTHYRHTFDQAFCLSKDLSSPDKENCHKCLQFHFENNGVLVPSRCPSGRLNPSFPHQTQDVPGRVNDNNNNNPLQSYTPLQAMTSTERDTFCNYRPQTHVLPSLVSSTSPTTITTTTTILGSGVPSSLPSTVPLAQLHTFHPSSNPTHIQTSESPTMPITPRPTPKHT